MFNFLQNQKSIFLRVVLFTERSKKTGIIIYRNVIFNHILLYYYIFEIPCFLLQLCDVISKWEQAFQKHNKSDRPDTSKTVKLTYKNRYTSFTSM